MTYGDDPHGLDDLARRLSEHFADSEIEPRRDCEFCDEHALVAIYATYGPIRSGERLVEMYPFPMMRTCLTHLGDRLVYDQSVPGASATYVVKVEVP